MKIRLFTLSALACALSLSTGYALAADQDQVRDQIQDQTQDQDQIQQQDRIYGSQLMTQQERLEFRERMRAAGSAEEREQIRQEHHQRMQIRAKERGVTLPDEPPVDKGGKMMNPNGGGMGAGKNR